MPEWANYFRAAQWVRVHADPGAVVACRKSGLFFIMSSRYAVHYRFGDPKEVLDGFEEDGVSVVIVDQLPFSSTHRYLIPAIAAHSARFDSLFEAEDPNTQVLSYRRNRLSVDPPKTEAANAEGGDPSETEALLREAMGREGGTDRLWQELLRVGKVYHGKGDLDSAYRIYTEVLAALPASADAFQYLGLLLYAREQYEESVEVLKRGVELNPVWWKARTVLAVAYLALNRTDEAITELRQAIRLNPTTREAHTTLVDVYRATGDLEAARRVCEDAVARWPDDPTVQAAVKEFLP